MHGEVRAVIDVGTNSVKLLVAVVDGKVVRPLDEVSEQTRLGQGFYESHILQHGPITATAAAVAAFARQAETWKPASLTVIATSAARDAVNRDELLSAISRECGLPVSVISGEEEAELAFHGVATDPALAESDLLVVDVGGGSTEFIFGSCGVRSFGRSFSLGTVRLLEKIAISDPPRSEEYDEAVSETRAILENQVKPVLAAGAHNFNGVTFVATGGTSTILARIHRRLRSFSRELIDGAVLGPEDIKKVSRDLWRLPLAERKAVIGLPSNRADVILPGVVFFDQMLQVFGLDELRISTRGLRFAALMR
jgi:exopolyphosphatase / guanosine-5'-triphosphate,3'-diphosphate pyrophosphatase